MILVLLDQQYPTKNMYSSQEYELKKKQITKNNKNKHIKIDAGKQNKTKVNVRNIPFSFTNLPHTCIPEDNGSFKW